MLRRMLGGLGSSRPWQLSLHYWLDELCRVLRDTPTARLAMRTLHLYNTKTDDERLGALGTVWCTASRTRKLIRCTSDCCNMHRSGLHRVRCCLWLVDHVKAYSPLLHARIGCPSAGLGYRLCIQARPSPSAPAFCPSFPCLPSHRRCFRAAASAGRHVWLRAPGVRAMRVIQPEKLAVARAETFGRRGFAAANRASA
jgi:hypothetical protein